METQFVRDSMTASSDRHGNKLSTSSQNVDRSIMALSQENKKAIDDLRRRHMEMSSKVNRLAENSINSERR